MKEKAGGKEGEGDNDEDKRKPTPIDLKKRTVKGKEKRIDSKL